MRKWLWALTWAVAVAGLLFGTAAQANDAGYAETVQPNAPQWAVSHPTLANAYYQEGAQEPTPAPVPDDLEANVGPPPEPTGEVVVEDETALSADFVQPRRTDRRVSRRRPQSPQPFQLFDFAGLNQRGIMMGGWVQQGITVNAARPVDRFNGPVATNDRDSTYQMNQAWLWMHKPVDTQGYGWDFGGRVDMLYGSDARFGTNIGLENHINALNNPYGFVMPQLYAELAVNNLSFKFGHFAGILDYEAIPSVANPFYSHSYSYGYTVPQLVTGMLGTYKVGERFSFSAGFHRGWMMFEDINNSLDFMAGATLNSRDRRTSITYAISTGAQDPAGAQERFVSSFVLKHQFSERFNYVLVHNLGYENDGARDGVNVYDAEWYGLNQYFLYTINPAWTAGLRFEWLRDDDGARIFGVPNMLPPVRAWPGGPGFAGDFYELSLGLNWRPHPNIVVRPECRWDWYVGTPGRTGLPFDAGNRSNQFTFATDLIVTF